MSAVWQIRRWWQGRPRVDRTPLDGDMPAWVVSLVLHASALLAMGLIGLPEAPSPRPPITITAPAPLAEDEVEMPAPEAMAVADEAEERSGAESENGIEIAQSMAPVLAEESVVPVEAHEDLVSDVRVEPVDEVATGLEIDATLVAKGAVGVGIAGASGAVDRLTVEIASALEQRPALVCWVFDRSVSLATQRKEIAGRLDRVFDELGMDGSIRNRPDLLNMVFEYGEQARPVTAHPTREPAEVISAIENIVVDQSGVEMTFTAIRMAAERARIVRAGPPRRNAMIVVFTDEVGNDESLADQTALFCRTQGIPVYVVGVPAPFGMRQVKMKFVEFEPEFAKTQQWPVVDQGPETLYPEYVSIHSGREADEPIDSGFGPFSLSKLCAETGGIYFAVHANRNARGRVSDAATAPMASRLRHFFDPQVMQAYRPDYVTAAKIDQMLAANRAKKALVEAARSSQIAPMDAPRMSFPREDDAALALSLGESQKAAARLQPKIDALLATLAAGAADRDTIKEKRWQAGYDLAMGRVLALKIRTDAYNIILAQAKSGMKFKNPKSDTWMLAPSDDVSAAGSQTDKLAKQARMYLERVVREHPGTPWALIADKELQTPLGYAWAEATTGVARLRQRENGGNGVPGVPADDARRRLAPPKPNRPLRNL